MMSINDLVSILLLGIICGACGITYSIVLNGDAFSWLRKILFKLRELKHIGKIALPLGLCEHCFSFWFCAVNMFTLHFNLLHALLAGGVSSCVTMVLAKYLDEEQ